MRKPAPMTPLAQPASSPVLKKLMKTGIFLSDQRTKGRSSNIRSSNDCDGNINHSFRIRIMSDEHKKQLAGTGKADSGSIDTGSASSESSSGNQTLSESSLDAVTGGADCENPDHRSLPDHHDREDEDDVISATKSTDIIVMSNTRTGDK
jgi:hypothetical protein